MRSGFIFGPGGKNFLSAVVTRAKNGEQITAISDAWGTPTYARDLRLNFDDWRRWICLAFCEVPSRASGYRSHMSLCRTLLDGYS